MRFTSAIFAAVALATSVFAQETTPGFAAITAPTKDANLVAGSDFKIEWQPGTTPSSATFTIQLLQGGPTQDKLVIGETIAAGVPNSGSYNWKVPSGLTFELYGIKISLDSAPTTFQYSNPFHIVGGSSSSSTVSTTSSASSSSTTSSTSVSTTTSKTSSVISSTVTGVTTSIPSPTSSTVVVPTTAGPVTVNGTTTTVPTLTTAIVSPSGNGTIVRPTSTGPAVNPTNAAGKAATGGFAVIGGLALAFIL
ncbi:GPI anchored serine-threonine rich protein [Glarea lozoyensis ATCC 20868]|uniref:GPI anchored serine-threonine rich protein n=1 Tax=Glarea lozoyensis (strain ATCC 20868 / MF5171) TaxID=1116229 RepID=S3DRR0_GLAL2|nr:GPI anchored serine-threonine rich protein [Glarea lozoyensis ATCC 20868]EPE29143.1 GPI anchored serine-threonine rich protein [Glarea lozoyensis ATCC 20868]